MGCNRSKPASEQPVSDSGSGARKYSHDKVAQETKRDASDTNPVPFEGETNVSQEVRHDTASDSITISGVESLEAGMEWSRSSARTSARVGKDDLADRLNQNKVFIRPETREFYQNLETFFELKQRIEGVAEKVMPHNALHKYEDIKPPASIIQACVPEGDLSTQLDVLYSRAVEAKPRLDDFGRKLVQQVGLEPDLPMLEQADLVWYTYTAVPLKARATAMKKAQGEYEGDARRLVDIVRASVVVDTETRFEAVVKCLYENYVENERDGVCVVRFKNRCKQPLADGKRDVQCNISVVLNDFSSRFVCELQIHMKQILDYREATHGPYLYFRSYFKGGDGNAVSERVALLQKFAHRDVDDISEIVSSALEGDDEDQLDALDELFYKLSELEVVVLIRRRQLYLARFRKMGNDRLIVAQRLSSLAYALSDQGKYDEAKPLYERSLRIRESDLGEHHPKVATSLNNLALLLYQQGKYDESKQLMERALRIYKTTLGEHHPDLATSLNNLGELFRAEGKHDEAKALIERSLQIYETTLGESHPHVAHALSNLGELLHYQGKYEEARPLYERSIRIQESNLGEHHPIVASSLNNLANLLQTQGKYDEAKWLYERSLRIRETNLGEHHPDVASSLTNLGSLLYYQGQYDDAKPLYERSLQIQKDNLGGNHPHVASSLNDLANLLVQQGKYEEAKPLYECSLRIRETNFGEHHPDVASSLNDLANLLYAQGEYEEATRLYERSLQIRETNLGEDHPDVARILANLALLSQDQGRQADAFKNMERAVHIFDTTLGAAHPHTIKSHRLYTDMSARLEAASQQ